MERTVRQLMRIGHSTAVTLPPQHLALLGLDRGALVEIRETPGGLLVRPVGLWALPAVTGAARGGAHSAAALAREARTSLAALYGPRLRAIHQERVSGRAVRLWIVLDRVDDYAAELERTGELVTTWSVMYGLTVGRVFVPLREWHRWKRWFERRQARGSQRDVPESHGTSDTLRTPDTVESPGALPTSGTPGISDPLETSGAIHTPGALETPGAPEEGAVRTRAGTPADDRDTAGDRV